MKRYLLTLVALLAMTTGAWADEGTLLVTINSSENTDFLSGSKTFDNIVTVTFSGTVNNGGDDDGWEIHDVEATPVTLTVTAAEGSGYTITSVKFTTYDDHSPLTDTEFPFVATLYGESYYPKTTISDQANGIWGGVNKIEVYGTAAPAGPKVTINDAKTTASFSMPSYDATVSYELVRDLSESVNFLGIPTGNGATVKKDGDKYTFASAPIITLSDVLNPSDAITIFYYNDGFSYVESGLTLNVYPMVEMEGKWKADETATPVALADFLASPQPGRWMIKATATTGLYDGTLYSPEFTLAEAYDLTLSPATDAHLKSVTVDGTAKTADEKGVIKNIEPTKKVKITTTGPDYIIRKAAVKKTPKANE